jgi:hypothetical protein
LSKRRYTYYIVTLPKVNISIDMSSVDLPVRKLWQCASGDLGELGRSAQPALKMVEK